MQLQKAEIEYVHQNLSNAGFAYIWLSMRNLKNGQDCIIVLPPATELPESFCCTHSILQVLLYYISQVNPICGKNFRRGNIFQKNYMPIKHKENNIRDFKQE
jgi:hypothetical protein